MRYILDTDVLIYLLKGNKILQDKVREVGIYSIGISVISLAELYFGAYNSSKVDDNLKLVERFCQKLNIYTDDERMAKIFGKVKANLKSSGQMIEDFDILIAGIAIVNDCTLITNNERHFSRIPDLKIENWLR